MPCIRRLGGGVEPAAPAHGHGAALWLHGAHAVHQVPAWLARPGARSKAWSPGCMIVSPTGSLPKKRASLSCTLLAKVMCACTEVSPDELGLKTAQKQLQLNGPCSVLKINQQCWLHSHWSVCQRMAAAQVGCSKGGAWYEDYAYIGGQHRYAVDQYGGGRGDPHARASARLWYTANVAAAGLPMVFMGTEFAQSGWWCASLTAPELKEMQKVLCSARLRHD